MKLYNANKLMTKMKISEKYKIFLIHMLLKKHDVLYYTQEGRCVIRNPTFYNESNEKIPIRNKKGFIGGTDGKKNNRGRVMKE